MLSVKHPILARLVPSPSLSGHAISTASGGLNASLGPTCAMEMLGATFTIQDDQSCIPLTLLEVPCDVRSPANNCIWEMKGNQCGVKQKSKDCKVPVVPAVTNSTTVPVNATMGEEPQIVLNAMCLLKQLYSGMLCSRDDCGGMTRTDLMTWLMIGLASLLDAVVDTAQIRQIEEV